MKKLKWIYSYLLLFKYNLKIFKKKNFRKNKLMGEVLRYIHSIEKGLSISNPRPGFGVTKVKELLNYVNEYIKANGDDEVIQMSISAIGAYLNFQNSVQFYSDDIKFINDEFNSLKSKVVCGNIKTGVEIFSKTEFNVEEIEKLFNSRHSFRQFTKEPVSNELIEKAIKLAQRAPSACNRQAVRVYNISAKAYMDCMGDLSGIGGFAEDVDRFLLITSVQSEYRNSEINQHIVSASIFAGYLSLALQAYGIGACVIQRPLVPSRKTNAFKNKFHIPFDEQVIVMLGVGNIEKEILVPVSHRLDMDKIYKKLD